MLPGNKYNTALHIVLESKSSAFDIDLKTEWGNGKLRYCDINGNWLIELEQQVQYQTNANVDDSVVCINCNENHRYENCEHPNLSMHCKNCLILSLDGNNHLSPCQRINKISLIRPDILATPIFSLFRFIYDQSEADLFYLHKRGRFKPIKEDFHLFSPITTTVVSFDKNQLDEKCRTIVTAPMWIVDRLFRRRSMAIAVQCNDYTARRHNCLQVNKEIETR